MPTVFANPAAMLDRAPDLALGASDWLQIGQARIDAFADVTGDHQWIHVDPVRAAEGPFGSTIAHGYLTLSLVNFFLPQILDVQGFSSAVNVGCAAVKFLSPVKVGARIRGAGTLLSAERVRAGAIQSVVRVTVEIEGQDRPACIADTISRYFPLAAGED